MKELVYQSYQDYSKAIKEHILKYINNEKCEKIYVYCATFSEKGEKAHINLLIQSNQKSDYPLLTTFLATTDVLQKIEDIIIYAHLVDFYIENIHYKMTGQNFPFVQRYYMGGMFQRLIGIKAYFPYANKQKRMGLVNELLNREYLIPVENREDGIYPLIYNKCVLCFIDDVTAYEFLDNIHKKNMQLLLLPLSKILKKINDFENYSVLIQPQDDFCEIYLKLSEYNINKD